MIIREYYSTRSDGVKLYRTYSDQGVCISRDGAIYEEAIDPEGYEDRIYEETTIPIPNVLNGTDEEAREALNIILNGEEEN